MNKFLICILILFKANFIAAYDWGRYWCFGDSAAINFANPMNPIREFSYMDSPHSCTSIGDSANGLLMYAHTNYLPFSGDRSCVIRNSNHQVIQNGDSLIGAGQNGLVFINKPESDSIFYLFQWEGGTQPDAGISYSTIDPYFNNVGKVLRKNIQLQLSDSATMFGILAIKHGNGRDWWILVRNWFLSNRFNLFLVLPDTITGPFEQSIGLISDTDVGGLAVSKSGDKIALALSSYDIETYDFDRCSGIISNPRRINTVSVNQLFGCEFSPDGNLLYVSNTNNLFGGDSLRIFQFDLTSTNPGATKQIIYNSPDPAIGGMLRRGPDDKIYFSCMAETGYPYPDTCRNQYNENLGVINEPNNPGLACMFAKYSFHLGNKRTYWDLPNIPNFNLREISGSNCDSLTNSIAKNESEISINIFPNPCSNNLNIINSNSKDIEIEFYDARYRLLFQRVINDRFLSIDLSDFTDGIYFLKIDKNITKKVVIIK